jgi:hypothetical protein
LEYNSEAGFSGYECIILIAKSLSHKMIFLRGPLAENKRKVREIILRKIRGTTVLAARKKRLSFPPVVHRQAEAKLYRK